MFHKVKVNGWATIRRKTVLGKMASGLMLLLWLVTFAAAGAPDLHRFLHKDSQSATHQCVVTQVQQHLFIAGFQSVGVPTLVLVEIGFTPLAEVQVCSVRDFRLSP